MAPITRRQDRGPRSVPEEDRRAGLLIIEEARLHFCRGDQDPTGLAQPVNITAPSNFDTSTFANFQGGTFSVMSVGNNVYVNYTPKERKGWGGVDLTVIGPNGKLLR